MVRDVAWNAIVQRLEEPFRITGGDPKVQQRLDEGLRYSLKSDGQALLLETDEVDRCDVLLAFSRLVNGSADEYCAVALSPPQKIEPFMSLFASRGGANRVAVPKNAIKQIKIRIEQKEPSRALFVHNHPEGIIHDILGAAVLGPSAQDRQMLTRAYQLWFGTEGRVRCEFYLVEGGTFRKFVLPSAGQVWNLAQQLGLVKP